MDYKIGDVMRDNTGYTYGDAVIVRVNLDGTFRLSRPYAYATLHGTTLTGFETIDAVRADSLNKFWTRIAEGRVY